MYLILSGAAAYLLYRKIPGWYLLAPVASFLAVSVISNTDVKVAGIPLLTDQVVDANLDYVQKNIAEWEKS